MEARTYNINGDTYAVPNGSTGLYRLEEEIEVSEDAVEPRTAYFYDGKLIQFDQVREYSSLKFWYRVVGSEPPRRGSAFPHHFDPDEEATVRRTERAVPTDVDVCPECGDGWVDLDEDDPYCLQCGWGLDD